ncbi:phosphomethylpyrimidine kinase [Phlyctema vagabunda]|uniref:Phosphomethylpyrimidine kinase n=1 Tax=Phlyctema vagabunda TaxID=108571 RepID=A0ABR4PQ24_9HELO
MVKGRVLVIAGSDSSGGAGLEADQKTIAAHGCYAMTATTALTAQNTLGVIDINLTPPEFVRKQIDACISDVGVDVVKTGMLAAAETIRIVAESLHQHDVKVTVIDPVMVATTGAQLLPGEAVRLLREHLLPITTILTPNFPEANLILSDSGLTVQEPKNIEDLIELAKAVQSLGPKYVLLKGGHIPFKKDGQVAKSEAEKELMVNILYGDGQATRIESPYYNTKNTHGTGCSLASAIASNLANGLPMIQAVKGACRYVEAGIKTATDLGHGNGPINHFHSTYSLPFAPGHFVEYLLERPDVEECWRQHTEHKFVAGLADGTLPLDNFKYYLIQDYLYLIQFARASALAGFKAKTIEDIAAAGKIIANIHREMDLHVAYCKEFGVTKEEMESIEESQACTAYTRYVLDIGQTEDLLALQVSMAPCLIGYMHIAKRLFADPKSKREGNIYWKWIEAYVAENYEEEVRIGSEVLEKYAVLQSPSRIEELAKIFIHATNMETGFWNMGTGGK